MARFNEILTGRFNRALQKELQLKGGPPSAQLASEIMPVLSFFRGIEDRILESWNIYGAAFASVATAGIVTAGRLRNPKSSGVVGVIQKLYFHNRQGADQLNIDFRRDNPGDFGTISTPIQMDGRNTGNAVLIPSSASAAITVVGTLGTYGVDAAFEDREVILTDDQEITLLPGSAITIVAGTVNTSVEGAFWWRERSLEDSELSA